MRASSQIAICLLHAWRNPVHEQRVAAIAAGFGFRQISASHETSPLIKLVSRGETTVADAYLSPVLLHYVRNFRQALAAAGIDCPRVLFMQSNGGLVTDELFRGKDSVLSGPAGGVVGMAAAAEARRVRAPYRIRHGGHLDGRVVVCRSPRDRHGNLGRRHFPAHPYDPHAHDSRRRGVATEICGRPLPGRAGVCGRGPGSAQLRTRWSTDRDRCQSSAGAHSGGAFPAHIRAAGGPGAGPRRLLPRPSRHWPARLVAAAGGITPPGKRLKASLRVATDNMANAVHQISVQRGLDPAEFTLCCFGGAGGQHACRVADQLGMRRILLDPLAGVLSAWGMGAAALRAYRQQTVGRNSGRHDDRAPSNRCSTGCSRNVPMNCSRQASGPQAIHTSVWLEIRESGSDTAITLPLADTASMRADFAASHQARYGFVVETPTLVIDAMRVEAEIRAAAPGGWSPDQAAEIARNCLCRKRRRCISKVCSRDVPVYRRERLRAGMRLLRSRHYCGADRHHRG